MKCFKVISFILLIVFAFKIYDIAGKEIESLYSGELSAGEHTIQWFVEQHVDNGFYFPKIKSGEFELMKKISVIR